MNTAPRTSWKHCLFVELIPIPPPAANPGNEFHMDPWRHIYHGWLYYGYVQYALCIFMCYVADSYTQFFYIYIDHL